MIPLMIVASIILQFQNDLKNIRWMLKFSQKRSCVYQAIYNNILSTLETTSIIQTDYLTVSLMKI
jgi:CIC family chloride channel protein